MKTKGNLTLSPNSLNIKSQLSNHRRYVEDPKDGSIKIWIARRSKTKPNWPGMLDHVVAGGQVGRQLADGSW